MKHRRRQGVFINIEILLKEEVNGNHLYALQNWRAPLSVNRVAERITVRCPVGLWHYVIPGILDLRPGDEMSSPELGTIKADKSREESWTTCYVVPLPINHVKLQEVGSFDL
ncbi:unnamed protein product [Lepidochelys kempii]